MNSKLQNQSVDIQLRPMYSLLIWKADFGKVRLYDVYKKQHYYNNILTLTNEEGVIGDSLLRAETARQTRLIDSLGPNSDRCFRRAVSWYYLRNYDHALTDLNTALSLDSTSIAARFTRACVRFELILQIASREEQQQEIVLQRSAPKPQPPALPDTIEHTYGAVISDLDLVLTRDPGFPFAWYNRGFVNSRMGKYKLAIDDFSQAIALQGDFAEAFYNRGLMSILLQDNHQGCLDLSRAGELGVKDAYRVMKRYCYK
jgi:tetratricopeptide (TPR) repeat protein